MVSQVVLTARLILINKIPRSGDLKRARVLPDLMYRTWKKAVLSYLFKGTPALMLPEIQKRIVLHYTRLGGQQRKRIKERIRDWGP